MQFVTAPGPNRAATGINTWNLHRNLFVYRANGMRVWAYDGDHGIWMLTATPLGPESVSVESLPEQPPVAVWKRLPQQVRALLSPRG